MKKARYRDFEELKLKNERGQRHKCCFATQAGITLVALVVTIVVLLILAGVTITYVFSDNGILSQAQSAANKTDAATALEEIQSRLLAIQLANTDTWTYSNEDVQTVVAEVTGKTKDDITVGLATVETENGNEIDISSLWVVESWHYADDGSITNGMDTLKIGDYVDYSSGTMDDYESNVTGYGSASTFTSYTGTWQVLGVDEKTGQILLISSTTVGSLGMMGQDGYENCLDELEKICKLYATGTGAASGRCVTVEDINKITGYNPKNVGVKDPDQSSEGERFGAGAIYVYGNEVTYSWNGTNYPYYTGTIVAGNMTLSTSHSSGFYWWDGSAWDYQAKQTSGTITTLTSDYYVYYPTTLTSSSSGDVNGITTSSTEYSLLFGSTYWLGSRFVRPFTSSVDFGCHYIKGDYDVSGYFLYTSYGFTNSYGNGVRPVIYLDSDISLTYDSIEGEWVIS